jgi:hypothetical protein
MMTVGVMVGVLGYDSDSYTGESPSFVSHECS